MNSVSDTTLGAMAVEGGIHVNQGVIEETIVFGDSMLPFLDDSMVFKGVVDSNGAIYLDPVTFAALVDQPLTTQTSGMTFKMIQMPVELLGSNDLHNQQENLRISSSDGTLHSLQAGHVNQRMVQSSGFPLLNTTNTTQTPISNSGLYPSDVNLSSNLQQCNSSIHEQINNSREDPSTVAAPSEHLESTIEPPIGKGPFRCQICGKEFSKWLQFRRHKTEHLDEKLYRCRLCSMTFNFEANLDVHTMIHEAESSGILQCQLCPTKFSRLASLKSHLRIHETEENLVCQECGDEFPTKARLETHLEEHKTRHQQCMLYRCRLCSKTFTQAALLKDHSKEHAAIRNQLKILHTKKRRKNRPKPKMNSSNNTSSNSKADKAAERHERKKQQQCSVCGKRFEKPSQLVRHIRIHTGEKPFSCKLCDKRFNQKGTLETHIQAMHDKVKPFKCYLCSVEFSQRGNLKAHVLKVHVPPAENEKVFKCEECPCVYRRLATLNNHIAKAHTKAADCAEDPPLITIFNDDPLNIASSSGDISITPDNSTPVTNQTLEFTPRKSVSAKTFAAAPLPNSITIPSSERTTSSHSNANPAHSQNNSASVPQSKEDCNITEVKLAHDSEGKSRRCVVKVKKVGHVKWHMCPFCEKAFRKPSDLIRHIRIHTQEKPYTCNVCGKSFAVKSTLITHVRTHCPRKPEQECRVCHKRFSMLSSLKAHERLHTGVKPFVCMHPHCGRAFRTSSQRRMHYKIHKRNVNGPTGKRKLLRIGDITPQIDLPDPLKITSEGLVPVPNRSIQSLILKGSIVEGKGRPYKCQSCPAAFKKSSHLKQHVRSHTGERPYKCFQCFRNFVSSGVLKNHIKTHEGVRAFKCIICNISFTTNGSLTRHMATHTSSRPYVCPYCHKTWKTSVSCRKHIKTHRSEIVAFHSVDNQPGVQGNINYTDDFSEHDTSFDDGIRGVVASVLGGVVPPSNVSLLDDPGISSVAENVSSVHGQSTQPLNQCINLQQHSMQDMNTLISVGSHSITVPNGEINIQYSAIDANQIHNSVQQSQITVDGVPVSNVFDGSVYTLQGDHLELPSAHSITSFVSNPQQEKIREDNCKSNEQLSEIPICDSQSLTVPNVSQNGHHSELNPSQNEQVNINTASSRTTSSTTNATRISNNNNLSQKVDPNEKDEIKKIREFSQSISEAIYHDLKTHDHSKPADPVGLDLFSGKVNACHICTRAFKKRSDLQRHIRIHTGEKPFRCQICGKAFRVKSTKEAHMRTHEGGKTVSCHICNNLFSTKSSLRVHMRLHTGDKPYSCPHCDRCFRTSGHRKAHVQSHFKASKEDKVSDGNGLVGQNVTKGYFMTQSIDSNKQNCQMLPPVQTIKDKSSILVNTHDDLGMAVSFELPGTEHNGNIGSNDPVHVIGSLQLTMEGPTIQNIQITSLDLNSLPMDENFLQSLGNVIFMTPSNIGLSASDLNAVTGVSVSTPVVTGKDVGNIKAEFAHNSVIADINSLTLPTIAGNATVASNTENVHVINPNGVVSVNLHNDPFISHSVVNPPISTIACVQRNSNKKTKEINRNKEAKRQPTQNIGLLCNKTCTRCGKKFGKPSLLARHMRIHTGEKPYHCAVCKRTFSQRSSLDAHSYTHTNERPFLCELCPFRTVQKAALKKHCSRAHPNVTWQNASTSNSNHRQLLQTSNNEIVII